jgi:hypothetical protein
MTMAYHFISDFSYCVNIHDVKLFDKTTKNTITLKYPEAAVLDLLIKQYPHKTMVRILSKIGLYTESHAESILGDTLDFMIQHKILVQD